MDRMRTEIKTSCLKRLKRIEGQIRGLAGMVEDDRYCIDVVTQIAAAKAALRRVEEEILRDHVAHCVEHAISSGDGGPVVPRSSLCPATLIGMSRPATCRVSETESAHAAVTSSCVYA